MKYIIAGYAFVSFVDSIIIAVRTNIQNPVIDDRVDTAILLIAAAYIIKLIEDTTQ